jgi:hypothetical protein
VADEAGWCLLCCRRRGSLEAAPPRIRVVGGRCSCACSSTPRMEEKVPVVVVEELVEEGPVAAAGPLSFPPHRQSLVSAKAEGEGGAASDGARQGRGGREKGARHRVAVGPRADADAPKFPRNASSLRPLLILQQSMRHPLEP